MVAAMDAMDCQVLVGSAMAMALVWMARRMAARMRMHQQEGLNR